MIGIKRTYYLYQYNVGDEALSTLAAVCPILSSKNYCSWKGSFMVNAVGSAEGNGVTLIMQLFFTEETFEL